MNYQEIKQIIKDMEGSSLAELCIEFPDGTKISLKNDTEEKVKIASSQNTIEIKENVKIEKVEEIKNDDGLKTVISPMVGTFYAKSSPNADPFVSVGKHVKVGDILCIVEAMKLMNEIESEYDGEVVEILVKDGEMVDYGKPLFKIK